MPTPRSEAIRYFHSGASSIHTPETQYDTQNKQEHYAVLAQVVETGVSNYLTNTYDPATFSEAATIPRLSEIFRQQISDAVVGALESEAFEDHYSSLEASQLARRSLHPARHRDVKETLRVGTNTFATSFEYIFSFLQRHYGVDQAGSPENWRIADHIAQLDIRQFSAYYYTYLTNDRNWSQMMEHLTKGPEGGIRFKPGYPKEAFVTETVADPNIRMLESKDFLLDGSQPLIQIKDIESLDGKVGCPITFSPKTIRNLWQLYAAHAHHLVATPPIINFDGSEASQQ